MKRWSTTEHDWVERPDIDAFLAEVEEVCRRHGFTISHEDGHGAFEIVDYDQNLGEWLAVAHDKTKPERLNRL